MSRADERRGPALTEDEPDGRLEDRRLVGAGVEPAREPEERRRTGRPRHRAVAASAWRSESVGPCGLGRTVGVGRTVGRVVGRAVAAGVRLGRGVAVARPRSRRRPSGQHRDDQRATDDRPDDEQDDQWPGDRRRGAPRTGGPGRPDCTAALGAGSIGGAVDAVGSAAAAMSAAVSVATVGLDGSGWATSGSSATAIAFPFG